MHNERTMYPMMGVGAFNIMFWVGFVAGHNIGRTCGLMLLNALFFGGVGSYAVLRLERFSRGEFRPSKRSLTPDAGSSLKPLKYSSAPLFQT